MVNWSFIGNWICLRWKTWQFLELWKTHIWDKVIKNVPNKICRRQPLKNLKWDSLLKQTKSLQIFKRLSSTYFTCSILEYFLPSATIKNNVNFAILISKDVCTRFVVYILVLHLFRKSFMSTLLNSTKWLRKIYVQASFIPTLLCSQTLFKTSLVLILI